MDREAALESLKSKSVENQVRAESEASRALLAESKVKSLQSELKRANVQVWLAGN